MLLALHTAAPNCKMVLIDGEAIHRREWLAERRLSKELLGQLETFLSENNVTFNDLNGLIVFRGPGSYTGLRIGMSVMNALAYGLNIPIVGETGETWLDLGVERLSKGDNDNIVIPEYGGLPHITQAKK